MNTMQSVTEEQSGGSACVLQLKGELTVSNAQQLHLQVLSACEKYPQVSVVLDDITAFDVSAMQILLAAVRETTTRVDIRLGENSGCVTHWLNIAGLHEAVPVRAA